MRKALLAATALTSSILFLVPGAQAFDWNGPYVGGVVGVVKSTGDIDWWYDDWDFGDRSGTHEFSGWGALAGVTVGANFTLNNNLVVGIEGDASLSWLDNTDIDEENFWYAEFHEELQSLLTLRGRIGMTTPDTNTLFYVTGGIAGGNVKASGYIEDYFAEFQPQAATVSGFVVGVIGGVGVEHAVTDDLTVKAELLGYSLGSLSGDGFTGKGDSSITYNPSGIIFRTGINFHF